MLKENCQKYIIQGIIVFLIFYFSKYFQLIPIKLFNIDIHNPSIITLVLLTTFSSVCLMIVYFFIYQKDLKKEFKIFMKKPMENIDIGMKYWIIGLLIMAASNLFLSQVLKTGGANNENMIRNFIKSQPLIMFISSSFIAPFNEEIAFRKTLKDVIKEKWFFAFLSFLLFGGAHVIDMAKTFVDYLYIIPYGAMGGAFALAYYETDTIFTSMFMHMFHNAILSLATIIFMLI